jgi:hypothetical protein
MERPLLIYGVELLLHGPGLGEDLTSYLGNSLQKVKVAWQYAGSQFLFAYLFKHNR